MWRLFQDDVDYVAPIFCKITVMWRLFHYDLNFIAPILGSLGLCGAYFRKTCVMRRLFQEDLIA